MKIGKFVAILLVCYATTFSTLGASTTVPEEASKFLDTLASQALNVLRSSELSLEVREAKVRGLLAKNFDLPRIGRFVLGKSWRGASDEQKREYQHLFGQFLTQLYANTYGKRDALVLTEITRPNGPPLKAGWRVRNSTGGLKILDVMVEGVSMAATQRSEFGSVIKSRGVDGLLEMLRLKVYEYSPRNL
jgi:phospholipid transport system substrate-binding protein